LVPVGGRFNHTPWLTVKRLLLQINTPKMQPSTIFPRAAISISLPLSDFTLQSVQGRGGDLSLFLRYGKRRTVSVLFDFAFFIYLYIYIEFINKLINSQLYYIDISVHLKESILGFENLLSHVLVIYLFLEIGKRLVILCLCRYQWPGTSPGLKFRFIQVYHFIYKKFMI
jgi:hypothetical protein